MANLFDTLLQTVQANMGGGQMGRRPKPGGGTRPHGAPDEDRGRGKPLPKTRPGRDEDEVRRGQPAPQNPGQPPGNDLYGPNDPTGPQLPRAPYDPSMPQTGMSDYGAGQPMDPNLAAFGQYLQQLLSGSGGQMGAPSFNFHFGGMPMGMGGGNGNGSSLLGPAFHQTQRAASAPRAMAPAQAGGLPSMQAPMRGLGNGNGAGPSAYMPSPTRLA